MSPYGSGHSGIHREETILVIVSFLCPTRNVKKRPAMKWQITAPVLWERRCHPLPQCLQAAIHPHLDGAWLNLCDFSNRIEGKILIKT